MFRVLALCGLCLLLTQPGHAKARYSDAFPEQPPGAGPFGQFSAAERHLIRAYFAGTQSQNGSEASQNLPPGLEKNLGRGKRLPPGWQQKLAIGDNLDYHIYRMKSSLPVDLLDELPKEPADTEVFQIQDTVFRIQHNTRLILDFFNLTHGGH
ncbi:MAG: hypothetical protein JRE16_00650 [Deltaproteobacteria bacterium]|nr:hypothetical protein [Deltaproteobacteria bacterium]